MNVNKLFLISLLAILASGSVFSAPKSADNKAADTYIVATLNNGPVMDAIELEVRQMNDNSLIEKTKKHSTVLSLTPGNYMAIAKMNNIVRNRAFSVIDHNTVNVVIAMDK